MTNMDSAPEDGILTELGARLSRCRVAARLTQAELATQAGVSKRTVERLENGASTQLSSFIRIMRALQLLPNLEQLLPSATAGPIDLLEGKTRPPQRVRSATSRETAGEPWRWSDDT